MEILGVKIGQIGTYDCLATVVEAEKKPKLDDAMDIVEARDMEEDDSLKDP